MSSPSSAAQWKLETTNIAKELKILENECAHSQSKYYASQHGQDHDSRKSQTNSINCDKKSNKSDIALKRVISFYQEEFTSLRYYRSEVLGYSNSIRKETSSPPSSETKSSTKKYSSLQAKKDCERIIRLYEKGVSKIRSYMKLEIQSLLKEYLSLETFLKSMEAKINKWDITKCSANDNREHYDEADEIIDSNQRENPSANNDSVTETRAELAKLVSRINNEIANDGGNYGTWNSNEHEIFLKAWTLSKGDHSSIINAIENNNHIKRELVHRTKDEIMMHVAWFIQHQQRCGLKKRLVTKWRRSSETKSNQKHSLPQCIEKEKEATIPDYYLNNGISDNDHSLHTSDDNEVGRMDRDSKRSIERKKKKELIKLWKIDKENKARHLKEREMIQKKLRLKKASRCVVTFFYYSVCCNKNLIFFN